MSVVSKNVVVSLFGTFNITVNVHGALASKARNVQVCTGLAAEAHDPQRITTQVVCATCGVIHVSQTSKAREVPDGYVVLTADDIAEARTDSAEFKKRITLTPHPLAVVDLGTVPGEKTYWLAPVAGNEQAYGVLARLLDRNTSTAFLGRFTPRTAMGVFSIHAVRVGESLHLLMRERVSADALADAPSFIEPATPIEFDQMADRILADRLVNAPTPFTMDSYTDVSSEKLDALVAARTALPAGSATVSTPAAVTGALAALQAAADALAPVKASPKKRAPRKTAAKKVVAAKPEGTLL